LLHIRHHQTGEDLYPLIRAKEKEYPADFSPLTRRLFRAYSYWVTCSDDHMGEYVAYGWEAGEHGYDFEADERSRIELREMIESTLTSREQIPDAWFEPSGERGVSVIAGILHNQKRFIEAGVVYNRGTIPNLPSDLAVEVPVIADAAGIHPVSLGPLPDPIAKLLQVQASVQQLAVEAAVHASKELALEALLIDPVVNSSIAAIKLLDELWGINKSYIRPCI
jgi:alpha-galactosidase